MHVGVRSTADALPAIIANLQGVASISSRFQRSWNQRPNRNEIRRKKCAVIRNCAKREFICRKTWSMKTPVMLLLTNDNELEDVGGRRASEIGGISHLTRDAGDALETICGVH